MKPTTSEKCISVRLFEFLFGSKNNPSHPRPSTVQGAPEQIEEWTIGGNYRILNRMGTGGTACVLRALDTSLAREVAIKILLETESTDEELTRRFLDEGRILAGLRHPNLVTVHAMGVDERLAFPFLVMELVHGSTLDDHIDEYRTYPTLLFRDMVTILETIHYCHQRHVIHLDLKPSNIMLDQHGTIRIIDFGIAVSGIKPRSDEFALGTALYMAPEQFTGSHELSPATDIYALGVILWELLTGPPPFQAASDATDSFTDLAHRHLADEPPIHDLMRLPHAAPLAGLISSMLSKHPEKRPAIQLLIAALKVELLAQGGSIRDRYHVRQTISRTPNYLTFIAFDRLFSRPVVIRMLSAEASLDPDLRDRFLDRARELANHPLPVLPAVLSIDRDPATTLPYLVEERVEGVRLNVVIPALQARPLRLFRLFRSIWQALVVCRDAGIVHGNLVPSSILVSDQETIRFVDTVPISPPVSPAGMTDPDADDLLKLAANTFTPLWTFRGDAENANAPFATLVLVMADRLRQWGTAEAEGQSLSRLLDRCEALFARLPSAPPLGTVLHEKLARIQELIEAGTSASLRLLRTALQEETDPAVLAAILPGLARLGNSNTLNSLLPYLADYRPELRIAAIEAIRITGNIGAALSIFPLASDPVPLVCEKAEKALSEFDSRLLVDQLQTFALLGLPEQRILAIKALCRYPSEDHLTLMRLLADSEHHDVAAAAREAVKDILSRKLDNGKHTPAGISHDVAPVLRKLHGHAIVCGYGRMGRLIVETLLAAGTECVIIEASEERLPTSGPSQAIKTLLGRGEHAANLLAAGISRARYLFAVTNDDSVNLDISLKAKMLLGNLTRLPPRPELSCVAQVFTHQVRMREERAGRHSRDAHRLESLTSAPGFEMHFLDLFAMAARNIVALYPPPSAALRQQLSGQPLHLLLLGAGPVSIRLSALLISLFQGPEHGLLRLTIIDTPERLKKAAFHTLYPRIDQIVDLNLVPMAHEGITPDTLLRLQGLVPFSSIYIMHEDRERAIEIATRAASLARGLVMVMLDTGPIRGRNAPHVPAGIPRMPFPGPSCTTQSFLSEADAAVARALFHAGHPDKEYEWARLPAEQRTPYLLQAAHLPIQLLTIGSRLVANSDAIRDFSFTGTELREMARLEHRRKAVESLLEASQSPTAVEQLRQSAEPALPWESLQEHTRAGLEARIARLPAVLAELGLGITRENSTQGQPRAGRAEFPTRSHSNGSNTRSTRASMRQVTS